MAITRKELHVSRKRSVVFGNKRTSISLEDTFWHSLNAIVQEENISIGRFIDRIPKKSIALNLSSSIRVAVLKYYKESLDEMRAAAPSGSATSHTKTDSNCDHDALEYPLA